MKWTDDNITLAMLAAGFGLYFYTRQNSNVGTFDPNAPGLFSTAFGVIPMHLSANGYALLEQLEGFKSTASTDTGTTKSIGYGHDIQPGETFTTLTQAQAKTLLQRDVAQREAIVNSYVTVPLNQSQFDALVLFVYNVGAGAFESSTMLKDLNAGNYSGASAQFTQWVNSNGKVSQALVARRDTEQNLFNA